MSDNLSLSPVAPKVEPVKANRVALPLRVPVGHVLPLGDTVTEAFTVTVEAGARWHPDWDGPRIAVTATMFMAGGDAFVWSGDRAMAFPLPEPIMGLAALHGQPLTDENNAIIEGMGLAAPKAPEGLGAFVLRPALARH